VVKIALSLSLSHTHTHTHILCVCFIFLIFEVICRLKFKPGLLMGCQKGGVENLDLEDVGQKATRYIPTPSKTRFSTNTRVHADSHRLRKTKKKNNAMQTCFILNMMNFFDSGFLGTLRLGLECGGG